MPVGQDSTTTILSMLQKLSESNQSLMQRAEKIEQRNSSDYVAINQPSQVSEHPAQGHEPMVSTSRMPQPQLLHTPLQAPLIDNGIWEHNLGITQMQISPLRRDTPIQDHRGPRAISADIQSDGVVPSLEAIRRVPSISNAVSNLLVSYEDQAKASVQGRQPSKSGRYNSTDMARTAPEFWWPNEGFMAK